MSMEDVYVKHIENGIRGIRLGTKTPLEAKVAQSFERLKKVNEGMHQDLMAKYKKVVEDWNKKNTK